MEKKAPIYQLKQMYLTAFKSRSKAKAINSLKSIENISLIREVIRSLSFVYPNLAQTIRGIFYPKGPQELSEKSPHFFKPESLESELIWALSYMQGHWSNIAWFDEQKWRFEHNFLLGKYNICTQILDDVKNRLGVSLWYFEAKCLLFEYDNKASECVEYISSVLEKCQKNKNYVPSLIYNLYERTSVNMSPYKFDEDLNALYKRNKTDLHEDYYKYVLYRLNYYNQYSNVDLSLPIMFESLASLIDRFLIIISAIKAGLARNINDDSLLSKAIYIFNKTKAKSLYPIIAYKGRSLPENYYNVDFIKMLDSYYSGSYTTCKNQAIKLMQQDATLFDTYVFYCRSLVYLDKNYLPPTGIDPKSPLNDICKKIYDILTYNNAKDNLYDLYRINKNLYSFHIAAHIDNFIKIESNESFHNEMRLLHTDYFDPIYSKIWNDTDSAMRYINQYESIHGESLSCSVWKSRIKKELVSDLELPKHISEPINATYYFSEKKYDEAYHHCESLYLSAENYVPIRQTAVSLMIECLFCKNDIQTAIYKYVYYYISDLPSVAKVDTKSIIKHIQENLYEGVRRNIDLVIFVALTCKDTVDKSFVLFEFCEIQGVKVPSELINKLDVQTIGIEKVALFFSLMNDDETLRHYLNIESFKERLMERKKILQYIISLNSLQKELYQTSLKKVEDALLVYDLSHNLDESKIYANDEAIIKYKLAEIEGRFCRYRLLLDTVINKHKDIFVVDFTGSSFFDNQVNYEQETNSQTAINSNGLYEVFRELYFDIREQFLNSEYGLVAYLSTRVRHGELETMLRPEMAKRHLILSIKNETYVLDTYWAETYNLSISEQTLVNQALNDFSKKFDNAVTYLIKQKLQIFEKSTKPEGLFNYEIEYNNMTYKAMEIGLELKANNGDRVYFCQLMLKWLWEITEQNLNKIRCFIDIDFNNTIMQAISDLEMAIQEKMPEGYAKTDILAQIRSARETITSKIQKVSKWFTVSHPKLEDVDIVTVTKQVYDSVRISHTNCRTDDNPVFHGETFKIQSTYVIHYADIIRNVIYNMFKHSIDASDGKRHFVINIQILEDELMLHFVNETDTDSEVLNSIFREKIRNDKHILDEGGSGIAKANKILKCDLNNNENSIAMKAENGRCYTDIVIKLQNFKVYEKDINN